VERVVLNALANNAVLSPDFRSSAFGTGFWPSAIDIVFRHGESPIGEADPPGCVPFLSCADI
jgi:hypothetical protein